MINRTKKAFTLLELIVVLLVLGILAAIAVPTFNTVNTNAAERAFRTNVEAVARNAVAIAVSSGYSEVHTDELTLATQEAGLQGQAGMVYGNNSGYSCYAVVGFEIVSGEGIQAQLEETRVLDLDEVKVTVLECEAVEQIATLAPPMPLLPRGSES